MKYAVGNLRVTGDPTSSWMKHEYVQWVWQHCIMGWRGGGGDGAEDGGGGGRSVHQYNRARGSYISSISPGIELLKDFIEWRNEFIFKRFNTNLKICHKNMNSYTSKFLEEETILATIGAANVCQVSSAKRKTQRIAISWKRLVVERKRPNISFGRWH